NFYMGRRNRIGVMAGALIYIFNGFTMAGMRHHYFLNPFVFFPLLLIGCELYFRKKKPWLFLLMVFVTAVSNFYFFYMMVIMTVLYAVWRSVRIHGLRHFGAVILDGISFVWYGLIGTLLSSFIFLPIVLRFLQDPRTADTKQIPLFWPLWYYQNFIDCFLSNGTSALSASWTYMGFGAVALLCVLFIFVQRKKHFDLKAAFVGLTLLLMTPAAAYVMNGFSYPANRWMWAYALLVGTMTATAIPELAEAGWKKLMAGLILFTVIVSVCVCWKYTFSRASAQSVILGLLAMAGVLIERLALAENERERLLSGNAGNSAAESAAESADLNSSRKKISAGVQAFVVLCAMLSIASAAYYDFAPGRSAKVLEYLSRAQIETNTARDSKAAAELIDGQLLKAEADENGKVPFYRYTTYNPENNTSLLYGVSNTQYYWSLSDPSVSQFLNETGQLNRLIHLYDTLDDRTFLNEIAGIRYFLGNDEEGLPYGYEKKAGLAYNNNDVWPDNKDLERYSCEVYENKYALPIGFTTNRWISRQDYDKMDIPERQQALMQGILLEKDPGVEFTQMKPAAAETAGAAAGNNLVFTDTTVPVQIEYEGALVPVESGKKITVECTKVDSVLTVRFEGMKDCETGLYIRGMQYASPAGQKETTSMDIPINGYIGGKTAAAKHLGYSTPDDPWTTGRTDFYVNMRYQSQPLDRIEITLPSTGTYTFDSIEVVCQPMTGYEKQAEALRASSLTDLDIHEMGDSCATDRISGHIELTAPQILCIQIPCTAGWSAYVD
ncbi:MAG: YfhO family protein, partial [Clostridium sp.]|nr:YfhO family protein [Clostridium sp.]